MSIELLIAIIGLITAVVTLLATLEPFFSRLPLFIRRFFIRAKKSKEKVIPPKSKFETTWFVNVGEHKGHIRWEDCLKYGCIGAGGGARFARALRRLRVGDKIYAYISGSGYVGCGEVMREAVPIKDFTVGPNNTSILEANLVTTGLDNNRDNLELTEWVAGIKWLKTFERHQARSGIHVFRPTLCEIQQPKILDSLKKLFGV
jgi:hypothetical protein